MEHRHSSPGAGQGLRNHSPGGTPHGNHAGGLHAADEHTVHSHGQHAGHSVAMFRDRFWLTLALAVPVVFFSPMFADLLGYEPPAFPGSAWIPPVFGTAIFLYGGRPFLKGGLNELRTRKPGMMLLIAMAISVAFIASWVTSLGLGGFDLDFWWELALLVPIMLLGHWIEMRALGSAQGALDALAALLPDEAERVTAAGTETVSLAELRAGDTILVRPGGRMPADGTVSDGPGRIRRIDDHGRIQDRPAGPGRSRGGRNHRHGQLRAGPGVGHRRGHRPGRDPAPRGRGAGILLPGPGPRRPGRGASSSTSPPAPAS